MTTIWKKSLRILIFGLVLASKTGTNAWAQSFGSTDFLATEATAPVQRHDQVSAAATQKSTAVTVQYQAVPGTAFKPRSSATAYGEDIFSPGCISSSSASEVFNAPVVLPDGSTIIGATFWVSDVDPVNNSAMSLTRIAQSTLSTTDLVSLTSSGLSGFGFVASSQISETVDNFNFTYVLKWRSNVSSGNGLLCSARVAYSPQAPAAALCSLDADGNGSIDALTDGLLIMRAMFGLTGNSVTNNAIGSGSPSRTTWAALRSYFNGACGASFAQ